MVFPLIPIAIGGTAIASAVGGWWLKSKTSNDIVTVPQEQQVTNYFDNRAYSQTTQYSSQYFFAPVENANLTQTSATAIKQQQEAGEVAQTTEQGAVTSGNINTALLIAGGVAATFLILRGVSK